MNDLAHLRGQMMNMPSSEFVVFEPYVSIRTALRDHIGGARGLVRWLAFAEALIEQQGEPMIEHRIARCERMTADYAATGQLGMPWIYD